MSQTLVYSTKDYADYLKHGDLLSVKMKDISPDYLAHYQASIDLDGYLKHYGVKGMKWGVRKDRKTGRVKSVAKRTPLRGKNESGNIRNAVDNSPGGKANHKAVRRSYLDARVPIKQGLRNINNDDRFKGKDLTNEKSKLVKAYHKEISAMVTEKLAMSAIIKSRKNDKVIPKLDYDMSKSSEPQLTELRSKNQYDQPGIKNFARQVRDRDMNTTDKVVRVAKRGAVTAAAYTAASSAIGTGIIGAMLVETLYGESTPSMIRGFNETTAELTRKKMEKSLSQSDDEESGLTIVFDPIMDAMGHITDVTFDVINPTLVHADLLSVKMKDISPDYLAHYQDAIDLDDYLMHHGIKGMKWGVRRTPEQLGHRVSKAGSSLKKKVRSVAGVDARTKRKIARTRRKARVEVAKLNAERAVANAKAKQEADAKKRGESSTTSSPQSKPGSSTQTTAISKRKGTAGLSDDELRYAVSRMNLEKSYAQLIAESTPKTNKQKFNAWAKKTAIGVLETQAKAMINQVGNNTTKKLMASFADAADDAKSNTEPKPKQPKQPKQPQPQPQPKPQPKPQPTPQPTPPPKSNGAQFGKVSEEAWQRYKANGPPPPRTSSWRDGPSVIRDNIDEPIGSVLELYDPRRRR